jgi:hypothetical protein
LEGLGEGISEQGVEGGETGLFFFPTELSSLAAGVLQGENYSIEVSFLLRTQHSSVLGTERSRFSAKRGWRAVERLEGWLRGWLSC